MHHLATHTALLFPKVPAMPDRTPGRVELFQFEFEFMCICIHLFFGAGGGVRIRVRVRAGFVMLSFYPPCEM